MNSSTMHGWRYTKTTPKINTQRYKTPNGDYVDVHFVTNSPDTYKNDADYEYIGIITECVIEIKITGGGTVDFSGSRAGVGIWG